MPRSTARARASQDRTSFYSEITNKIIAELEAGRVPWVQPWGTAAAKASLAMPTNAATQRRYSGVNVLILWGAVVERGFAGQNWLTFRQALSLGGGVRRASTAPPLFMPTASFLMTNASEPSATVTSPARSRSSNDSRCSTPISVRTFPTD